MGLLGSVLAVPLTLFFKALLVDSDPRTRWLDAFLVSEKDAESRRQDGRYDVDDPGEENLPHFHNIFSQSAQEQRSSARRPKLSGLTRQLKKVASSKK